MQAEKQPANQKQKPQPASNLVQIKGEQTMEKQSRAKKQKAVGSVRLEGDYKAASLVLLIPLALIDTAPQIRTEFDAERIAELARDIEDNGLLQPVLLNPNGDRFTLIAGERRLRALRLLERAEVPALVTRASSTAAMLMQAAENLQREQLNLEDTVALVRMLFEHHGSGKAVAETLHKSKSWVSKHLAASHPEFNFMARNLISEGYTEDLEIAHIVHKALEENWNEGRELVEKIKARSLNREEARAVLADIKAKNDEAIKEAKKKNKVNQAKEMPVPPVSEFDTYNALANYEDYILATSDDSEKALKANYSMEQIAAMEAEINPAYERGLEVFKTCVNDWRLSAMMMRMNNYFSKIEQAAFLAGCEGVSLNLAVLGGRVQAAQAQYDALWGKK